MSEKKKSGAITRLTPNALVIQVDGQEVRVPTDKKEVMIMNMVVAHQVRQIFQATLKEYRDKEAVPTPKELRDIISGGKELVELMNAAYGSAGGIESPITEQPALDQQSSEPEVDFSKMSSPKMDSFEVKTNEVDAEASQ